MNARRLIFAIAVALASLCAFAGVANADPDLHITSPADNQYRNATVPILFYWNEIQSDTLTCKLTGPAGTESSPCTQVFPTPPGIEGTGRFDAAGTDQGVYTFTVEAAYGPVDNPTGTLSDSVSFTYDTQPPELDLVSPADGATFATTTVPFAYSVTNNDPGQTEHCGFDGAPLILCETLFAALPTLTDGSHSFTIETADKAGNQATVVRTFNVEARDPTVTLTPLVGAVTNDNTPSFAFSADESVSFACSVDGGAAHACSSPFTPASLADGAHSVSVTATDVAAKTGVATFDFTVDTAAPSRAGAFLPQSGSTTVNHTPAPDWGTVDGTGSALQPLVCKLDGVTIACPKGDLNPLADGSHTFAVIATDAAGNSATFSTTFTVVTEPPTATVDAGQNGATNDNTPSISFSTGGVNTLVECKIDAGAYAPCASPFTAPALADGQHTFTLRVTDEIDAVAAASASFIVDTAAPTRSGAFLPQNGSTTLNHTPDPDWGTISGTGSDLEPLVCKLDGVVIACPDGELNALADGSHTFSVIASDAAGNTATFSTTFTVVTQAPSAAIGAGQAGATNDNTPSIVFTTGGVNTTVECKLDAGEYAPCASPFVSPALDEGEHTFTVRVTDEINAVAGASVNFIVDTAVPTRTGPFLPQSGSTTVNHAPDPDWGTISGTGTALAPLVCKLDGVTIACPAGALSALANGVHTFAVVATDLAGNTATFSTTFTVVTQSPTAAIGAGQSGTTGDVSPSINFTVGGVNITVECKLDANAFAPCSSPFVAPPLADGPHSFTVRVTDEINAVAAASVTFTVDTISPSVSISPLLHNLTTVTTPTLTFTAEAGSLSYCTFDSGTFVPCTSPYTTPSLSEGSHTFMVYAIDAAGNYKFSSYGFVVDSIAPALDITAPVDGETVSTDRPDIAYAISGGTATCSIDAAPFSACEQWFVAPPLANGTHTLTIRGFDPAGNVTVKSISFIVDDPDHRPYVPEIVKSLAITIAGKVKKGKFSLKFGWTVELPPWVDPHVSCKGNAVVTYKAKKGKSGSTSGSKTVPLKPSSEGCSIGGSFSVKKGAKGKPGVVTVDFAGSPDLAAFSLSKTVKKL